MSKPKLRVWWQNNHKGTRYFEVSSRKKALEKYTLLADSDLANPNVTDNSGGCEVWENGEWVEFYDNQDRSISDLFDEKRGLC